MDLSARISKRQFDFNCSYSSFQGLKAFLFPSWNLQTCLYWDPLSGKSVCHAEHLFRILFLANLVLEKKLRFPGKSFSFFVFPPHFWRSIHFSRKICCCSVFIYFVFLLNTWSVRGKVFPLSFVCLCWASENFSVSATLSELSDGLSPSVKFHCGKHFWLDGLYRKCISVYYLKILQYNLEDEELWKTSRNQHT